MTDELQKKEQSNLAIRSEEDAEVSRHLLSIRKQVETDQELAAFIASRTPAVEAKFALMKVFDGEGNRLFEKALDMFLEELEQQRKSVPSLYLVNANTGQAIRPISEKDIITPPDYVGEDGLKHHSRAIVHPGMTSAMGLAFQEKHNHDMMLAKAREPGSELAYAHLTEPEKMIESTKDRLNNVGVMVDETYEGPWTEIEFGRENISGMEQSVNTRFHRLNMFSAILARKILGMCGNQGRCAIGTIRSCGNSKHRWYVVQVQCRPAGTTRDSLGQD